MFKNVFLRRSARGPALWAQTGAAMATAAVLALGLTACGGTSSGAPSGSDSASAGTKTIRYGYEQGSTGGLTNDIATAVLTDMGYKIELVPMAFDALIPSLQSGRIDIAGSGLYITPPRCKAATFSEPTAFYLNSMAVKKGNPFNVKTLEDVAKSSAKVAALAGSDLARQAKAAGVPDAQVSTYQDMNTALEALLTGRVDVVPYDDAALAVELAKPAYSDLEATPPTNPVFDDGVNRPYASGLAFPKDDTEFAKQYSEKQAEFFKERTKAVEIGKKYGFPESGIPTGDDTYKMSDYCAHAGA